MKDPAHIIIPNGSTLLWVFPAPTGRFNDRQEFETARLLTQCPKCGAASTLTELPPPLRAIQPDGTTHVCHPALGGCNHGFEVKP